MIVETVGDGYPEVSVVVCLHGDEPSGKRAVDRLLAEDREFEETVQFIVANEEAMDANTRAVDVDLNRAFPGNRESNNHEDRLAPEILEQVRDTNVLDIHATNSTRRPFAISVHFNMQTAHLARSTGLETVVDTSAVPNSAGGLISNCPGVSVECGHKDTDETVETAYDVITNFLAANGALEQAYDYPEDPQLYRIYEKIDHPTEQSVLDATDFTLVRAGEQFLTVDGGPIVAEQDFYPVLASDEQNSYDFVGFKAKNTGTISQTLF